MQINLIALKDGSPDGNRRYRKGERYSKSEKTAQFLSKIGWARIVEPAKAQRKESGKQ